MKTILTLALFAVPFMAQEAPKPQTKPVDAVVSSAYFRSIGEAQLSDKAVDAAQERFDAAAFGLQNAKGQQQQRQDAFSRAQKALNDSCGADYKLDIVRNGDVSDYTCALKPEASTPAAITAAPKPNFTGKAKKP